MLDAGCGDDFEFSAGRWGPQWTVQYSVFLRWRAVVLAEIQRRQPRCVDAKPIEFTLYDK
jgi:hypothetical protein